MTLVLTLLCWHSGNATLSMTACAIPPTPVSYCTAQKKYAFTLPNLLVLSQKGQISKKRENPKWPYCSQCGLLQHVIVWQVVHFLMHLFVIHCVLMWLLKHAACAFQACVLAVSTWPFSSCSSVCMWCWVTQWDTVTKHHLSITTHELHLSLPYLRILSCFAWYSCF